MKKYETLADYIRAVQKEMAQENQVQPVQQETPPLVYPEQVGEEDRPRNPYSQV